eukprot:355815-Chlamydomonas_euryale.AAC.1
MEGPGAGSILCHHCIFNASMRDSASLAWSSYGDRRFRSVYRRGGAFVWQICGCHHHFTPFVVAGVCSSFPCNLHEASRCSRCLVVGRTLGRVEAVFAEGCRKLPATCAY